MSGAIASGHEVPARTALGDALGDDVDAATESSAEEISMLQDAGSSTSLPSRRQFFIAFSGAVA
ncbi:MAG: hypothetical protein R2843_10625 [Thermomicrobiales bacterium]